MHSRGIFLRDDYETPGLLLGLRKGRRSPAVREFFFGRNPPPTIRLSSLDFRPGVCLTSKKKRERKLKRRGSTNGRDS